MVRRTGAAGTLQYTATHCSTLQHTAAHCSTLQHTATHCNRLQHIVLRRVWVASNWFHALVLQVNYNTLQYTATHSNTLQHTATHCNTLQHTATHCSTLLSTATLHRFYTVVLQVRCNTLQRTATQCNTLQHTTIHCNTPHVVVLKNQHIVLSYGVAKISRLLKIIGLFCKRALQKRQYSAKETYNFKAPTNRSHTISMCTFSSSYWRTWCDEHQQHLIMRVSSFCRIRARICVFSF